MKDFRQFLAESDTQKSPLAEEGAKLKHIQHVEDHIIDDGEKGFHRSYGALLHTHNHMLNKHNSNDLTMKYDGAPSIVYGHHPETKKFFVSTKSAFNKEPKINYTPEDIDANHPDSKGLKDTLKAALLHLPKVTPKGKVYQGDVLYHDGNKKIEPNKLSFQPNTINYSTKIDSDDGAKIAHSRFGLVTHTQYHGNTLNDMQASFNPQGLKKHADVYNKKASHDTTDIDYDEGTQKKFHTLMKQALDLHASNKDMYHPLSANKQHVKSYLHHITKNAGKASAEDMMTHIYHKYQPHIDSLKTKAGKGASALDRQKNIKHIDSHRDRFDNLFKLHDTLQKAKNVLVKTLSKNTGGFDHHIGEKKTKPEGFVVHYDGIPSKLVDRAEFTKANAENNKFNKPTTTRKK